MTDYLKGLQKEVDSIVPKEALVTRAIMLASELVIYTKNIGMFLESEELVKKIAAQLKKRVHFRSDKSLLIDQDTAKAKIIQLVPKEAGIAGINFDIEFNEVVIEAKKPGLVIGKHGVTLKAIVLQTGWYPKILREPITESSIMKGIRFNLLKSSKERRKFLKKTAERIYRNPEKPTDWVKLTPLGASREVGRSCLLLQTPESKVLLDCGYNVASRDRAYPLLQSIDFAIEELDAVILSHAHLDHSGFLPYLYKMGFRGPTYATPPTRDLMAMLQLDLVDVTVKEGKKPAYGHKDVKTTINHTITRDYGEVTDIAPDIRLTFQNAGHILGSATCHMHIGKGLHNVLYTGDYKYGYSKLFDSAHTKYPRVETLITEATYGGPNDVNPPRHVADQRLIEIIKETTDNGGSVLCPVFAIGRSQELMLVLEEYAKNNTWDIPVYLDGMVKQASAIHTAYPEYLRKNIQKRILHNNSPFDSPIFIEVDKTRRADVAQEKGSVIIAPSGMLTGGPSYEYFKKMAEDPKNAILFVGWQGEGSLGRKVQNIGARGKTARTVPVQIDGRTRALKVNMRIETVEGFSGHSDKNQLIQFVKKLQPKPDRIITVHGEESKCINLARTLGYGLRIESTVPRNLDTIRLK